MQPPRSLGIVGHGDFGRFLEILARRFAPDLPVLVFARKAVPDGSRFFSLEETSKADLVIIAVSIRAFEETLLKMLPLLGPQTVLVDVNTVKVMPVAFLRRHAADRIWITTHPMFGPYSFEKQGGSLTGLRVVVTDHTLPAAMHDRALIWMKDHGLNVLSMTADAHDRMLAETLFLTHYLAQAVARGGFIRTDIDTLSFGYLMDAVESVRCDTELFRDVFAFNPHCEEIITRFEIAEAEVHALLGKSG